MSQVGERPVARAWVPGLFLLVCAPVVVDLLFGATQLTTIVALIPETTTYGFAALLIRGCARRRNVGWLPVVVWGFAFAVIAECLIVQTSLAPPTGPHAAWGRALGVNWPYLTWAVGYESGWAIALSIQLTDLVFPAFRHRPWPRRRSLIALGVLFVLAAFPTWYNWTHVVAPRLLGQPPYQPPPVTLAAAGIVAIALIALGWRLARRRLRPAVARSRPAPAPAVAACTAFTATVLWFALLLPLRIVTEIPAAVAITLAIATAGAAILGLRRWSRSNDWGDRHRLALLTGALVASMAAGFAANHFSTVDLLAKIVFNLAALGGLVWLYRRLPGRHRSGSAAPGRDQRLRAG